MPDYIAINAFMKKLKRNKNMLSRQQYGTLAGQRKNGDLQGAGKGLDRILKSGKGKRNERN